ncbi:uncharacterized protein LOC114123158 [Aphis gossypii]|uniref:uncharacterized protein LOC114123158 n=1 Tax=Aphis gossypii TaxID=80765 RepID=UPI0021595EA2|nr:uncharacterized protein LOC114123158 [Aphis gossypii]
MVIKSIFQTFNPTVETGPDRIISRHKYDDGFMPDYPAPVIGHDGEWVKPTEDDDDDWNVPTADYVDNGTGGKGGAGGTSGKDGAGGASGDSGKGGSSGTSGDGGGHRRLQGYSIQQHKCDAATVGAAAAAKRPGPTMRHDDYRPFSDFVVSLLETVQLTPRALLKKSKNKAGGGGEAREAKTTTEEPEIGGDIART